MLCKQCSCAKNRTCLAYRDVDRLFFVSTSIYASLELQRLCKRYFVFEVSIFSGDYPYRIRDSFYICPLRGEARLAFEDKPERTVMGGGRTDICINDAFQQPGR